MRKSKFLLAAVLLAIFVAAAPSATAQKISENERALFDAAERNGYVAKRGEEAAKNSIISGLNAGMSKPRDPLASDKPLGSLPGNLVDPRITSKALAANSTAVAGQPKGKSTVVFSLGYSHPIEYPLPGGIEATVDPKQTKLSVTGIDRQKVGQVAAEMRSLRPPDPYKNKGVRYAGEKLKKKVGKTGAK